MIEIKEIKTSEFDEIKDQLVELQYQNSCIHFPDKKISKEKKTIPTVNSIKEYMEMNKAFLFIAKENEDNTLIGFLWCYPREFFDESRIYINSLIVKEKYRNQHIGKQLMKKVEEKAKELECDQLLLLTKKQ